MESLEQAMARNPAWINTYLVGLLKRILQNAQISGTTLTFNKSTCARYWYMECYLDGFLATSECDTNKGKLKQRVRSFKIQPCYAGIMRFLQG